MRIVRSCIRLLFVFPAVLLCYNRTAVIFHSNQKERVRAKKDRAYADFLARRGERGSQAGCQVSTSRLLKLV